MNNTSSKNSMGNSNRESSVLDSIEHNLLIQENAYRHDQLLQSLPAAVYTCDESGKITFYNKAAAELWGREPEIGKDFWCGSWKIFKPDGTALSLDECPMAIALKEGRPVSGVEVIVQRPDGERRNIIPHPRPLFNSKGQLIGAVNMLVDITEIRNVSKALQESDELSKKNEELRRSEDRYHRMVAEIQDYAILLLNKDGKIENWNIGAEKIKGYNASEIVGKNFDIFYTPDDRESKLPMRLLEIASSEGRARNEGWRVRKDGSKFWGSIVITALHDDHNNIVGFSKVTRDLTERKLAEGTIEKNAQQLEAKNKALEAMNQELASFAYVSSHDLQEPLRKIQTFASRIIETEQNTLSEKGKDYFARMQNAALRMQVLIEDLLAYSRTNTADQKFETTDLNAILDEVKHDLKETIDEKHAEIVTNGLPTLNAIAFQVRQLFTNIISNSLKFSKTDLPPSITITSKIINGARTGIPQLKGEQKYHEISVRDNGIGFDPEHKHKIFEVFQRLHGRSEYSGTGIGLAICKKIMENHEGAITAESESDKGATFMIYFPTEK